MHPAILLFMPLLFPFCLRAQDAVAGDWVGDFYQSDDSYAYKITINIEKKGNGHTATIKFEWTDDQPHKVTISEDCGWDEPTSTLTLNGTVVLSSDADAPINHGLLGVRFSGKLTSAVNSYIISGTWANNNAGPQKPANYVELANCKAGRFTCSRDMAVADIAAAKIPKDLDKWKSENPAARASDIETERKDLATSFFNTYFRMNGATLSYDSAKQVCTITIDGCQPFPVKVNIEDFRRFTKGYNDLSLDRNLSVDWDSTHRIGIVLCFRFTIKTTDSHRINSWNYGTCL